MKRQNMQKADIEIYMVKMFGHFFRKIVSLKKDLIGV